ncbi:MAG TPA: HlyD family efflux transporter periplasmic adaptor subunit [Gemmataceae bacterium]|nr:HlyD family efflux transporter periplasmic adaptor subunit [Gemmataceae bacterium]
MTMNRPSTSGMRSSALLVGFALCLSLGCSSAPPAEEKAPPAVVKWEGPQKVALEEWTELAGTTVPLPDRTARVAAPVEGRVISLLTDQAGKSVTEGQRIEKGTVLVQLDTTIAKANMQGAEANQAVSKAEEQQAQNALEQAKFDVKRLDELKAQDEKRPPDSTPLAQPIDIFKANLALKDAEAKLAAAKAKLTAGEKQIEALRVQMNLLSLHAPINGRVGRIQAVIGQTLHVGDSVADVIDLDDEIDVLCFVPAKVVAKLALKQPALTGGFDADPGIPQAEGEIAFISNQADPDTGNFAVKVRFSNKEAKLAGNRVLRVRVLTTPGRECLSIREAAVSEDEQTPTVVIVTNIKTEKNAEGKEETTGTAKRLMAVVGIRDRTLHQIEIVRLEDPEKDPGKKWTGDVKDAHFVVAGGNGLQTGDTVKLDVDED